MASASTLNVFYFFQNEPGESLKHPNMFELAASNPKGTTLGEVLAQFPLRNTGQFHWRFRAASSEEGYIWADVTDPAKAVPLYGGNVFAKVLRLNNLAKSSLTLNKKRVGVTRSAAKMKTPASTAPRRKASSNATVKKPASSSGSQSAKNELLDFSGPSSSKTSRERIGTPPPRMSTPVSTTPAPRRPNSAASAVPARKEFKNKSADEIAAIRIKERKQAELQKQQKVVEEVREREAKAAQAQVERDTVAKQLGPKLMQWSGPEGNRKNVRALLSTMHQVLWEGARWKKVSVLVRPEDVKKAYFRAMLLVHPDKISQDAPAHQQFIARRCFESLNSQFAIFSAAEMK